MKSAVGRLSEGIPVDEVYSDFKNDLETAAHHDRLVSVVPSKAVGSNVANWVSDLLKRRLLNARVGRDLCETSWG